MDKGAVLCTSDFWKARTTPLYTVSRMGLELIMGLDWAFVSLGLALGAALGAAGAAVWHRHKHWAGAFMEPANSIAGNITNIQKEYCSGNEKNQCFRLTTCFNTVWYDAGDTVIKKGLPSKPALTQLTPTLSEVQQAYVVTFSHKLRGDGSAVFDPEAKNAKRVTVEAAMTGGAKSSTSSSRPPTQQDTYLGQFPTIAILLCFH